MAIGGGSATDVGSIRAGFVVDIADGKRKMTEIRTELTQTASKAKESSKGMKEFGDSIKEAAEKRKQLDELGKTLDNVNARIENQKKTLKTLKEAYAATFEEDKKTKLEAKILSLEASLISLTKTSDRTAREMWELEDSLNQTEVATDKAESSFGGLKSALTALGAGAAAAGIAKTVTTLVDEANKLGNALSGVKQVAAALGQDVGKVTAATEELANRGILSLTEAATAIKTGLATGYDLDQTIALINTLTDAAAYNREAHYEWGEAVVVAMQGIKSGNSTLTDAAGITTNLSVMHDKFAKSLGTTADKLTDAGKAQAAYNGMMQEAGIFAGNADAALEGYTGTNNSFKKSIEEARVELGEAFLPIVQGITEEITPLIQRFTDWASVNKDVVAGATAAGFAITGLTAVLTTAITVVTALKFAVDALKISLGPAGWFLLGVSAIATGLSAYSVAADAATESTWQFAKSQEELNEKLNESPLNRTVDDLKKLQADYDELNRLLERQAEIIEEMNALPNFNGGMTEEAKAAIPVQRALSEELSEVKDALEALGITTEEEGTEKLARMREEIEASTPALRELRNETLSQIAAQEDAVSETEKLADRYRELTSQTELTKEQSDELTSIVRKLTENYPELHAEMDEQGRLLIVNESLIRDLIAAESESVDILIAGERAKTDALLATAEAALTSAENQLTALEAVANAYSQEITVPEIKSTNPHFNDILQTGHILNSPTFGEVAAARYQIPGAKEEVANRRGEVNKLRNDLAVFDTDWRALAGSTSSETKSYTEPGKEKKSKTKTTKEKTAEEIAEESYRESLKYIQYKRDLNQMSEEQEIAALERLLERHGQYEDIRMDAEVRIYKIREQMDADAKKKAEQAEKEAKKKADEDAKAAKKKAEEEAKAAEKAERDRFQASVEWIEKKTREMTEAGATEAEIAQMQLDAWTRVRNRYSKDSDYYKRADKEMYGARMDLRKQDEKLAKEIADQQKDHVKDSLKAIEDLKNAELKALDERRKAVEKHYESLLRSIDESERGRERAEIEAEAEKYRYATSEKGKKQYADLLERLRKMDVEDQKQALEDERDTKLDSLDEQKADIESWYDDIKAAADNFNGDMIAMYQLTEDARLKAFVTTNQQIIAEMVKFQTEMAALQDSAAAVGNSAVIAQMSANSKAWKTADTSTRELLAAENQRLGQSINATYNSGSGKWFGADGLPLFHTGRDGETGQTFSVGDRLMPDEIAAILRDTEYVFNPGQLRSLLDARGGGNVVNIEIEKVVGLEIGEATVEDTIDITAYGRTGNELAADLVRQQFTKGE